MTKTKLPIKSTTNCKKAYQNSQFMPNHNFNLYFYYGLNKIYI